MGLEFYWTAFWELSNSRPVGWGFGPIPWTVVTDYATAYDLTPDEANDFIYLVRRMDEAWMDWQAKKQSDDSKDKPKK